MGLFVQQDGPRSELQSRVAAELQQKLKQTSDETEHNTPESRLLENQHQTRPAGVVIALLVIVGIGLAIWLLALQN